ncbi:GTPase IMAP family member 4-like [Oreochromis aureus]|uniref:GTPase IMAP family member 4-like n=1 Tax=Oreochromis aureus TaxID=47969 RepID=UPI00195319B2|nr:GTPase IMAP family member 4-like [Oreochromis aureus]
MGELRIVLYGQSGQGKSTLGGIILGNREIFTSNKDSKKCHKERKTITGQEVVVVDTPGLFKVGDDREEVVEEIKRSIKHAEPGPHVFLYVERFKEISQEKLDALKVFKDTFGKQAVDYTMVVFTTKKKEIMEETLKSLTRLTDQFQQRYFVFNIEDIKQQESQLDELLEIIKKMTEEQCQPLYTSKMLQEAEEALKIQKKTKPKPEEEWRSFYDRCGLMGMAVGCAVGYFICGGELTPTTGAGVGAVVGMMLFVGIAFLGVLAKIKD